MSTSTVSSSSLYPPFDGTASSLASGTASSSSTSAATAAALLKDPTLFPPSPLTTSASTVIHPLFRGTSTGLNTSQSGILSRQLTHGRSALSSGASPSSGSSSPALTDWRTQVTVEDRLNQRARIKSAYSRHTTSYTQLLSLVTCMEEELLFSAAVSRLDYFKSGLDWENRLRLKKQQLAMAHAAINKSNNNGEKKTNQENNTIITKKNDDSQAEKDKNDESREAEEESEKKNNTAGGKRNRVKAEVEKLDMNDEGGEGNDTEDGKQDMPAKNVKKPRK